MKKFTLVTPELSVMGNKKTPADYEGIRSFLLTECRHADALINEYMTENYPEITSLYEIKKCYMPWARMFEIGLVVGEK